MASYFIKKGDTKPVIAAVLLDGNGAPVNLTGVSSVRFHMRADTAPVGSYSVNAAAVVDTPLAGTVHYQWVAPDTDVVGIFYIEWEVNFGGGAKQTLSSGIVEIHERL